HGIYDLHLLSVQSASSLAAHKLEEEILSKENELQIRLCFRIRWGFRSDYRGWIDETTIAQTKSSTCILFAVKHVILYGFQDYAPENAPALALNAQIEKTKRRFNNYGKYGRMCGADGLPHLMVNGDQRHWGEFITPGLLFLYIAGWIGWAQTEAVHLLCGAKTQSNPENTVGILTMAGLHVGECNLTTAIQIAQLAFKHCQNKNQRERIIVLAEWKQAESMGGDEPQQRRRTAKVQRQHHWIMLPRDWIKCNTDGSFLDENLMELLGGFYVTV
ncbi:hypothetical protein IGI04_019787, partial [Brassica rapa subsp. trilocularis]